jgi:hypothetical protein
MPKPYEKVVLAEGGFTVELSNQGKKFMVNPNPTNLAKAEVPCLVTDCQNRTKNQDAICTAHLEKIETIDEFFLHMTKFLIVNQQKISCAEFFHTLIIKMIIIGKTMLLKS